MSNWDDAAIDWYAKNFGEDISNNWVMNAALIKDGEDVLDIGCGTGAALRIAEKKTSGRIAGVEPFQRMLDHAEAETSTGTRIEYYLAAGETLPFEDGSFDIVSMINVVHHLADVEKSLSEALRVLRAGGRILIGGESFDEDTIPEGQNYGPQLETLGFENASTMQLNGGDGFVTIATKGKSDV